MGKKVKRSLSYKENNPPDFMEDESFSHNSKEDTDIIECSILEYEDRYNFKTVKSNSTRDNGGFTTNVRGKDLLDFRMNTQRDSTESNSPRLTAQKRLLPTKGSASAKKCELSWHTPSQGGNFLSTNSMMKRIISTLKKTPDGSYLSKSKLWNIQQWLQENDVETVRTPPFANLSITPVNSVRKKETKMSPNDSSVDSEVEGVLKAVYGNDWLHKNINSRCKTEPKKKNLREFSPGVICTDVKTGTIRSARRNILSGKKLILLDSSEEDTSHLDTSVISGVKAINLDHSNCSIEQVTGNPPGATEKNSPATTGRKKRKKAENNIKEAPKNSSSKRSGIVKTPKKTFLASLSVSTPSSRCHPDAQDFKINFKSKKEELVKKLYKLYNGEVFNGQLAEDMNFSWNVKLRGTAGYCYNKRVTKSTGEIIRLSRIEFSTKIVDRADRLRDTMIHELCHAASWVIDGVLDGHGAVWSRWASEAMTRFPELPLIKRCHNYEIMSKYVYRCTGCGYSIKRHSKSIDTERKRCGHCYGVLELLRNKKKRGKGEIPEFDTTRTQRTPNKFAMFVKENYHSVKSAKVDAKHAEIMKTLSQQYALSKTGRKSTRKPEG